MIKTPWNDGALILSVKRLLSLTIILIIKSKFYAHVDFHFVVFANSHGMIQSLAQTQNLINLAKSQRILNIVLNVDHSSSLFQEIVLILCVEIASMNFVGYAFEIKSCLIMKDVGKFTSLALHRLTNFDASKGSKSSLAFCLGSWSL